MKKTCFIKILFSNFQTLKFSNSQILIPIIFCVILSVQCFGQDPADESIEKLIEDLSENADDEIDFTSLRDNLLYYKEHPINLNNATKEELESLSLLDEFQIDAILNHRTINKNFISIYELQTVDGLNPETIYKILPYVIINEDLAASLSPKMFFKDGACQFITRYQQTLETSKGYINDTTSTNYYLGSSYRLYNRFRFSNFKKFSVGVTTEKDPGEEFFKGSQKSGYDFYSAHIFVRKVGKIKALVIGDYESQFGQGLTLWTGLAFGKSNDAILIKKNGQGIKPYGSVEENDFLRGAATTISLGLFDLTMLFSHKGIDANLIGADTLTNESEEFSSFQTTGFHRTASEMKDRHSLKETIFATNLNYSKKTFSAGITAMHTAFGSNLIKSTGDAYKQFQFEGDVLNNIGLNYSYLFKNINLFGEGGLSASTVEGFKSIDELKQQFAYLNGAIISLDQNISVSILQRNYARGFHALHSNAFSESSTVNNEKAIYIGTKINPWRSFTFTAYYDMYSFPWLKYLVDAPSNGYEYLAELAYRPSKALNMYWRLKTDNKRKNAFDNDTPSDYLTDHALTKLRYHVSAKITKTITLSNRLELSQFKTEDRTEQGYLIYQDIGFKPMQSNFSFSIRYSLFDIDGYYARIYTYEDDVLYAYSIPAYQDRGTRAYFLIHYTVAKGVEVWLRLAQTYYNNRDTLGSDLDEIDGNTKTEVKAQVRFRF